MNRYGNKIGVHTPAISEEIINYEEQFGVTIKRKTSVRDLIEAGTAYEQLQDIELVQLAKSHEYTLNIIMDEWELPCGAYGESDGPS